MDQVICDLRGSEETSTALPSKEQLEVSWLGNSNPSEKELTQLTPGLPQSGLNVPTPTPTIPKKSTSLSVPNGTPLPNRKPEKCWRSMQMSSLKMTLIWGEPKLSNLKSPWKKVLNQLKNNIEEVHLDYLKRCRNTSRRWSTLGLSDHQTVPGPVPSSWWRKWMGNYASASSKENWTIIKDAQSPENPGYPTRAPDKALSCAGMALGGWTQVAALKMQIFQDQHVSCGETRFLRKAFELMIARLNLLRIGPSQQELLS